MLIETPEGVINTDHVVRARDVTKGGDVPKCEVSLANGNSSIVSIGIEVYERACGVIVPAHLGFTVIHAIEPDEIRNAFTYIEEPVIAFRVGHGGPHDGSVPITVSGEPSTFGRGRWAVRQPNGRCFGPDTTDESVDEFKAACEAAVRQNNTAHP